MKKLLTIIVGGLLAVGCSFDDSSLRDRIDDLDSRLESVEKQILRINSDIDRIGTILDKSASGKVITAVTETSDGYLITFSDAQTITVFHGRQGQDGSTPLMGVKADQTGALCWTVNGEFITDAAGNHIAVTGPKGDKGEPGLNGADGITPEIGIDSEGFWTVDTGQGPQRILCDGQPVKAVGSSSCSLFAGVEQDEDSVTFVLSDGSRITVPKLDRDVVLRFVQQDDASVYYGYTASLDIETRSIRSALVTAPCGWSASVNLSAGKVKIAAPFFTETDAEFDGFVSIIAVTESGQTLTVSKAVSAGQRVNSFAEIGDILSTVIVPRMSDRQPWDLTFELAERAAGNFDFPAALSSDAVPSITVKLPCGGATLSAGAYNSTYAGAVELIVPEQQSIDYLLMQLPRGYFTLSGGGTVTRTGDTKAAVMLIDRNVSVPELTLGQCGALINMGAVGTMNIRTGKTLDMLQYGSVQTVNQTGGTLRTLTPRPVSKGSSKWISRVLGYLPGPGQNINNAAYGTPAAAQGLVGKKGAVLTLGMFGGYVEFCFDHTVPNMPGVDFVIHGNSFGATSNEPGAVMVSFDENGNGEPDDAWYELKGELYDLPSTIKNYRITYRKPAGMPANTPIEWSDNQGGSGQVPARIGINTGNHFPAWFEGDELTLSGNRIEILTMSQPCPGYGYADTFTPDYNTVIGGDSDTRGSNKFDIMRAIDPQGNAVTLPGVDFIRVYNPVFAIDRTASFGEISPEVCGAISVNLDRIPRQASGIEQWGSSTF